MCLGVVMRWVVALAVGLVGCSDYEIKGSGEGGASGVSSTLAVPALVVAPASVDLGARCGPDPAAAAVPVRLSNAGDGALAVIGLAVEGAGWTLDPVVLPAVLPPGDGLDLTVRGAVGAAVLVVSSDDPASPEVRVPLEASLDAPPTVSIASPLPNAVLPVDAVTTLVAWAADDQGATSLEAAWASDVDGLFASAAPAANGESTATWDAAARSAGTHQLSVTATDACGQSAVASVSVCQDEGYDADNLDLASWNFEGSASYDAANGWVVVTPNAIDQSGTAFQTGSTVLADNVSIAVSFYASGGTGADGLSLTALDTTRMTGFVGSAGGGLGYQGLPGWSIEIDTWYNAELADPTAEDHVSLHFDGAASEVQAWAALPDVEDGQWHTLDVTVVAPRVQVALDGVLYLDQDVPGTYAFPAYIGFTAATGQATNAHWVDALTVRRSVCDPG